MRGVIKVLSLFKTILVFAWLFMVDATHITLMTAIFCLLMT